MRIRSRVVAIVVVESSLNGIMRRKSKRGRGRGCVVGWGGRWRWSGDGGCPAVDLFPLDLERCGSKGGG